MLGMHMVSMSALSLYRNAIQFGISILVTAFVAPSDYGLVVFTLPFVALLTMLTDMGLSSAIVRAPELSADEAGGAFTLMACCGLVMAGMLAAIAYPLSIAVRMPGLPGIMTGMACVVLATVLAATPRALLERRLLYARVASVEAVAVLAGAVAGVSAAWEGAGAWSLVLYNLVNHSLRALMFLWLARSDMRINWHWRRLRPLIGFGGWVLATNLLNFLSRNSDNVLIGASLGAAAVGIYGLAYQFMLVPLMAITWPASGILLATLRQQRPGQADPRAVIQAVLAATAAIAFPAMTFLIFGLAWPFAALLPAQWHGVPAIVAWLAPLGALQSVASYNGAILMVAGRARLQFVLTVAHAVLTIATFLVAMPFGLAVLVRAYVGMSTTLNLLFLATIMVVGGLGWRRLAAAVGPALLASGAGLATVMLLTGTAAASWTEWLAMTAAYGAGVGAVYLLLAVHMRGSLRVLVMRPA